MDTTVVGTVCHTKKESVWKWNITPMYIWVAVIFWYHCYILVMMLKYLTRAQRSIYAQIRSGIQPLVVGSGCLHSVPQGDRKCHHCDLDEVDRINYIHCPFYNDVWVEYFMKMSAIPVIAEYECRLQYKFSYRAFSKVDLLLKACHHCTVWVIC